MNVTALSDAADDAKRLLQLTKDRQTWARVSLASTELAAALNCSTRCPFLPVDIEMSQAIIWAVVNEYDRRIKELHERLTGYGVTGLESINETR